MSGKEIPVSAFVMFTIAGGVLGVAIAKILTIRARSPRTTFLRTTVALTTLSIIPDLAGDATVTTKIVLVATHLIAAAIIVPAIAALVPATRSETFPRSSDA